MRDALISAAVICLLVLSFSSSFGQQRKAALVCRRSVLAALKPKPELGYQCDAQANDWDEKILKLPARLTAINTLTTELSSFSDDAWWEADPVDLGV